MFDLLYREEAEHLFGKEFAKECEQEAISIASLTRPAEFHDKDISVSLILAVAIGKILNQMKCKKCGSIENVHCLAITEVSSGEPQAQS